MVSVNMMLVPDLRQAPPEATARAVAACEKMSQRNSLPHLYEEFEIEDRKELDDAILEMLGIEHPDEREPIRDRLYRDVEDLQKSIRDREVIAQQDRRRSSRTTISSPQDIADELWSEHQTALDLLQFPEDFVPRPNEGDSFDLPSGEVQIGTAMMDQDNLLKAGTVRVGGRNGEVLDVGTVSRSRFLEALSACHRYGLVRLPNDKICEDAVNNFNQYRNELADRCIQLAQRRTPEQQRQRTVANALLRKALQWRKG